MIFNHKWRRLYTNVEGFFSSIALLELHFNNKRMHISLYKWGTPSIHNLWMIYDKIRSGARDGKTKQSVVDDMCVRVLLKCNSNKAI